MNILISTIVRNRIKALPKWKKQLDELSALNTDFKFSLSVYENDSIDGSKDFLNNIEFPLFKNFTLITDNLFTNQYGSVKNAERVCLLADARNKSIKQSPMLPIADKIICIEPDITYPAEEMRKLITSEYDIISARSIEKHDDLKYHLYDGWGTRKNKEDSDWNPSILLDGIIPVWTTFNCFCVYKAEAIRKGAIFSGFNEKTQQFDCDTAIICERFRDLGYNNIAMNCDVKVFHSR
jgi:hypothetical protein